MLKNMVSELVYKKCLVMLKTKAKMSITKIAH